MKSYLEIVKSLQVNRKSLKNVKDTKKLKKNLGIKMLKNTQSLLPEYSKRKEATQTLKMLWNKASQSDTTPCGEDAPKNIWSQIGTGSTVDTKGSNRTSNSFLSRSRSCSQHFLSLRAKFDSHQQPQQEQQPNIFQQQYLAHQQQLNQQQQGDFMEDRRPFCSSTKLYDSDNTDSLHKRSQSADLRRFNTTSSSTMASNNEDLEMESQCASSNDHIYKAQENNALHRTPTKPNIDDSIMMTVSPSQFRITSDGYIWTPGNHKIPISDYLMQGDLQSQIESKKCPAIAAQASYAQDMYTTWRTHEKLVDSNIFQLSFRPGTDIEKFRRMAILFILQHIHDWGLSNSTAHISVNNIHRILLHYTKRNTFPSEQQGFISNNGDQPKPLTTEVFVGSVLACLRMAIKHEERPDKSRHMRSTPSSVCRLLGIDDPHIHIDSGFINTAEQDCLKIIAQPMTISSAPEFLERYLLIGQWPNNLTLIYKDLAHYFLSLSFFSRRDIDQLAGIVPSLLAAAALSLAIRVISAGSDQGYECWPQRLVVYTGYTPLQLKPGVRGLSALLRQKPEGSKILEKFHPRWANLDWK